MSQIFTCTDKESSCVSHTATCSPHLASDHLSPIYKTYPTATLNETSTKSNPMLLLRPPRKHSPIYEASNLSTHQLENKEHLWSPGMPLFVSTPVLANTPQIRNQETLDDEAPWSEATTPDTSYQTVLDSQVSLPTTDCPPASPESSCERNIMQESTDISLHTSVTLHSPLKKSWLGFTPLLTPIVETSGNNSRLDMSSKRSDLLCTLINSGRQKILEE